MLTLSRRAALSGAAPLGLLAAVAALIWGPPPLATSAEPAAALPPELQVVPADAAFFAHADAAQVWNGSIGKSVRAVDPPTFEKLDAGARMLFGVTPDALKSVTVFWPKLKGPPDTMAFGIVLVFKDAVDAKKLEAGVAKVAPRELKFTVHSTSDKVVVLLSNLDAAYAKPRPAGKAGPLTDAIREAGTGKHTLVAGVTPASLPDELQRDDLPPEARVFRPLYDAEAVTGILDQGRALAVEVRVKAKSPPKAVEAEKALGVLVELMQQGLGLAEKQLNKPGAPPDAGIADMLTILKAFQAGLKGAKFATDGEVARASAKIPADLPFASAYLSATAKVKEAASRAQSSNNLKQIALAFHNYHDTFNGMPPAAVCDKTGKPLLSWRVLILPYIEENELYKQFKLDEPWDSENNKKLLDKMPRVYKMPVPTKAKPNETHYRVFVGNGAAFDLLKGPRLTEFTDGTSNTILVATAADPVPWTKPDDLPFDPEKDMKKLLGFFTGDVCMVAFADGSVRALSKSISLKTVISAITRGGGEVLGDDF
jgi:hypothetical protein